MESERYALIKTLKNMQEELSLIERPKRFSLGNSDITNSLLLALGTIGTFFLIGFAIAYVFMQHNKTRK